LLRCAAMRRRLIIAALCCASLCGCFTLPWKKPAAAPRPTILSFPPASDGTKHEPRLIGHVAMVNTLGNFVLLECNALSAPSAGTAVKCLRYGAETAILNVGAERRSAMVVADIVRGTPARGDEVYQ
jgi:hypothetical protein